MKKQFIVFTLSILFIAPAAFAGANCQQQKQQTDQACDKKHTDQAKKMLGDCQALMGVDTGGLTGKSLTPTVNECLEKKMPGSSAILQEFVQNCSQARQQCKDGCNSDMAQDSQPIGGNPAEAAKDQQTQQYCDSGKPKQNEDDAKKGQGDIGQAMAALAQMLAALGNKPTQQAQQQMCGTPTASGTSTGTTDTGLQATSPALQAYCQGTIDKASNNDSSFADGAARVGAGTDDGSGTGDLATGQVQPGTPASQEQLSSSPGGMMGGGMMAPASSGGPSGLGSTGKKSDGEGSKIGIASAGSGGGGGGSMAGGAGKAFGAAGPITHSPIDGNDKGMAAAVEKAAQQRGIASDGPAGGITGANSLDNFQKVEKRMQSERNNLNETK